MSKRKREGRENGEDITLSAIEDRALRIKASRLQARVEQGVTALANGLKLAKAFDRQKMSRRQKQAGADQQKIERLKQEIEVLKILEPSKLARNYLMKQMVKTKRIARNEGFVALYGSNVTIASSNGVAEGNVLGRLFKANPVQEVLPGVMKGIYDVLALSETNVSMKGSKTTSNEDQAIKTRLKSGLPQDGDEDNLDDRSGYPHQDRGVKQSSLEINASEDEDEDDLYEAYGDRIALSPSSPESDLGLSTNPGGQDQVRKEMEITSGDEPVENNVDTDQFSDTFSSDDDTNAVADSHAKPTLAPASAKRSTSTAFLPSLSMGGYYSGSENESDVDESYDPDSAFKAAQPQPRKNRRGQRERQKIAEKKYGARANHLKKQRQQDEKAGRNSGWDARCGAVDSQRNRGSRGGKNSGGRPRFEPTGANADVVRPRDNLKSKSKSDNLPMHPSWEAARKRKLESQSGSASFSGRKTTFD